MRGSSNSYHHGDLARAALDEAVAIIRSRGAETLSMREVASRTGVAHRALYRHYDDREALLSAAAAYGYMLLAARLEAAAGGNGDARRRFASAYVGFALDEPRLYRLMMERSAAQVAAVPRLKAETDRVIALALAALAGSAKGEVARDQVIAVWSLLHGALMLHGSGLVRATGPDSLTDYLLTLIERG